MANYGQRNQGKNTLIQLGIFLAVILVVYGGDVLLHNAFDSKPFALSAYSAISSVGLLFLCVMVLVGFYVYDLVKKIKEHRLPKNFWSVGHIILKVVAFILVAFVIFLTVFQLSAIIKDSKSDPVEYEYTVTEEVGYTGKSVVFKTMVDDGNGGTKEATLSALYLENIAISKNKKIKVLYYENMGTFVVVEDLSGDIVG